MSHSVDVELIRLHLEMLKKLIYPMDKSDRVIEDIEDNPYVPHIDRLESAE
jgi:hypothetical protein